MTTRFAGSHSVDDRRRRRLAGENDEYEAPGGAVTASHGGRENSVESGDAPVAERAADDVRVSHFPVSRLISPKQWKLWAVGLLGLLIGVNMLLAGTSIAAGEQHLGPGFSHLFDLSAGRALKPMATLLLLLSSQLAWFIWWVRSRSPHDFDGRYRVWCWCAVIGFAATLTVATDLHLVWAKTALWRWEMNFWKHHVVVWLLPIVFLALLTLRALHREMRDCRSSLTLVWLAAFCGVSVAVYQLGLFDLPIGPDETRVACWSMELGACWLLFMSLLLHARHVVHVTPDPAQIRKSRFALRSLLRRPKLLQREKKTADSKKQSAKTDVSEESKTKTVKESGKKPRRRKRTSPPVEEVAASKPEPVDEGVEERTEDEATDSAGESPATAETEVDDANNNVDSIEMKEADPMQGLSKRERRRLRKQKKASKSGRKAG